MASNGGDASKRNKPSTNENNYNNKIQKNTKTRNSKSNAAMETTNGTITKGGANEKTKNGQNQERSPGSSSSSDEDRCWKFRPPPRGFTSESYVLCESFLESGICNFGTNCVEAHHEDELKEWKEKFEIRKNKLESSSKLQYGKSYTEDLLERLHQSTNPEKIMKEKLDGVEVTCSNELNLTVSSKTCKREWIFVLKTTKVLKAVALLQDEHRTHFSIKHVYPMIPGKQSSTNQFEGSKVALTTDQEWLATTEICKSAQDSETSSAAENESLVSHRVKICFSTDIYGTFRQAVCFDFIGLEAILVKHFCIDVVPLEEYDKIQEIKNDILSVTRTRWNATNSELVPYKAAQIYSVHSSTAAQDNEKETELMERYPCPQHDTFVLSQSTISGKLTDTNYQQWMHTLLYIEEMARFDLIAKFNLTTNLKITNNFILAPNGMATSTAKYSHSGELFGVLELSQNISEETPPGYLILNNCNSLYLSKNLSSQKKSDRPEVYEALIEDKSKNIIYLKLSADTVKALSLKNEDEVKVDIQFQPSRLTYCEWHLAVDKITDYKIIFPDINIGPDIPWNPKRQWDSTLDQRLNSKQREAVVTITSPINISLPPILLIGPFGTGKTYTLAQIIKQLLLQKEARILICTHSNSAADLYIREYLHPWVESGITEAKPLRIYYHKRWVATVNLTVQKYCLIELKGNTRVFKRPTVDDIYKHKIVVVTLSTSMELASLNLKKGYFTHILLDEAAQALECEAITPLALADTNTRIVLAGDHMQMSPEIFSNFARERKLHISLLERLYEYYPVNFPTKILLCENYRAHEAIIKFTSELFYDQKLIASGKQPRHEKFYPLTFFTTRGEDIQDKNSTAFYNNAEVYEIVERVCELKRKWPTAWGKFNDTSIGIMTPYADQVFRIRSELRKKRMAGISVERVLNVQGKQFRAVFLSTVRTRKTCSNKTEDIDYGFLSNSKLLNTAITRAQSLVSVVGDPVALCSVGRCRKVWERFIDTCHQNKSLYGITWQSLKSQLDGVELRKTYVLNPLAPEFIPRSLQTESYLRDQIMRNNRNFNPMMMPAVHGGGVGASMMQKQQQQQQQNHSMNFHHMSQQQQQHSFHPHIPPPQQPNQMMGPFPPPTQGFNNNNNNNNNNSIRPFGSPSYPQHPQPPNNVQQQFPPPFNGAPQPFPNQQQIQNFNQPNVNAMSHAQPHPPIMPNFHMNQHLNASNLWSSPNSLFPSGMDGGKNIVQGAGVVGGNPWQMKPPVMSQQQQQQIRSSVMRQPQQNQQPMFTPPPQFHQQPHMNSFQSLPKFPTNSIGDMTNSFNGNHIDMSSLASHAASKLTINEILSQPDMLENMKKSEKDVQFLQNVHFPEKQQMYSMNHQMNSQQQQTMKYPQINFHSTNSSHLLPPNMSFYEMANQSKDFQSRWYIKMIELYGLEEAEKFTEILRQVSLMTNNNPKHIDGSVFNGTIDNPRNFNMQRLMDIQQHQMKHEPKMENLMKVPSASGGFSDNFANKLFQSDELDVIFKNSVQNQKLIETNLLGPISNEIDLNPPSSNINSNTTFPDRNILNGIDLFANVQDLETNVQSPQRSVPLYMRKQNRNNFE
ncbi:CLUMA_CG020487, isoform A [Clunio marinus]|uniref:CLUMA_CG020487, isoform A n=1 Tax=Clunio marinus TaxID=568069 RepID=A0A1J1J6C4_9DIPT|nr:CLUMA_CG020487, isoform A [Clunio marinus]